MQDGSPYSFLGQTFGNEVPLLLDRANLAMFKLKASSTKGRLQYGVDKLVCTSLDKENSGDLRTKYCK